ncbi:MAG TPA: hypothetical protein OIM45_08595 [Clostridiaceae bacterium]|nr:hypothetical protein [Clostridiaceae bacterium]
MKTNEEVTKKNIINKRKIIISILLFAIIVYSIIVVYKLIGNPVDNFFVENGEITFEESTEGYIIRDETIVEGNNYKNGIAQIKSEGDKVAKGESIFRYYSNNEEDLTKKIKDLDVKIQDAMSKDNTLFSSDIKLLESQIEQKLVDIYEQNDIQKIKEYKKDINTYITKKAKIAGEKSPSGSYIKKLIDERTSYENKLNEGAEYVTAPKSGVVSYRVDGLEDVLSVDGFSKLNKKFLDDLKLKTSQVIATSEEKGKVINNFKCYLACYIKSDKAKEAKIGDKVKIRLPNSKETTATVEYISVEEDNGVLLVFGLENYVEELISYRKIAFDIIWWSDKGLKVPNSAILKDENNISYVVRNRAGYYEKIYVNVLRNNNNYSIVKNYTTKELQELGIDNNQISNRKSISLYDQLVLEPTNEIIKNIR